MLAIKASMRVCGWAKCHIARIFSSKMHNWYTNTDSILFLMAISLGDSPSWSTSSQLFKERFLVSWSEKEGKIEGRKEGKKASKLFSAQGT